MFRFIILLFILMIFACESLKCQNIHSDNQLKKKCSLNGRIRQITTFRLITNKMIMDTFLQYIFFEDGRIKEISEFVGSEKWIWLSKYNSNDNLVEEDFYKQNNIITKTYYYYNLSGSLILSKTYDVNGNLKDSTTYIYSNIGKKLYKQIEFHLDSSSIKRNIFTYDENGNILTNTTCRDFECSNGTLLSFSYDSANRRITTKYSKFNGKDIKDIYFKAGKYNNQNDLIQLIQIEYNKSGDTTTSVESYRYQYDIYNNWIFKEYLKKNGNKFYRKIEYYKP